MISGRWSHHVVLGKIVVFSIAGRRQLSFSPWCWWPSSRTCDLYFLVAFLLNGKTFGVRIFVVVDYRLDGLFKHSEDQGHLYQILVSSPDSIIIIVHVQVDLTRQIKSNLFSRPLSPDTVSQISIVHLHEPAVDAYVWPTCGSRDISPV